MNQSALEILQGELERLYELEEMMSLSADLLGFAPATVGGTGSKGAFARSLVGYCVTEDALAALVDAIMLTSERADSGLRQTLKSVSNGELTPGTRVGTMKVIKKLAEGGLSVVYLAEADGGQQTALKVIRTEYAKDRAAVHRFTTASRVMLSLRAPGLAPIVGVGQLADSRPWVAAELVRGQGLSERLKNEGPLHINDARTVFEGILQGLLVLHKRGLVHGDVKAENVFLVSRGNETGATTELSGVLVDAGVERLLSRLESRVDATGVFPLIGTAKAMAPEQARGLEPDARSDVYGMGTLMYETLTGRPPFTGDSAIEVIAQHVSTTPEPPSTYARRGWVSEALDEIVLRALAKEPSERFQDVASLIHALEHVAQRPSKRRPLDEVAFTQARSVLLKDPSHEAAADAVENQARDSGAWDRAATVFTEAARAARTPDNRLTLLFRAARIYESDLKDALRAEAVYQQILELEPSNAIALRGVESSRRASGDHHGLLEILLDRADRETTTEARTALLHEVATLYEDKLLDGNNAVVAWVQALVQDPYDARALRSIERLTSGNDARMGEALETLGAAAQQSRADLFGDDQEAARGRAVTALEEARAELVKVQARVAEQAEARVAAHAAERAARGQDSAAAQARLEALQEELTSVGAQFEASKQLVSEAKEALEDKRDAHEKCSTQAETAVETYEQTEAKYGEEPTEEQKAELATFAETAGSLVDEAGLLEAQVNSLASELGELEEGLKLSEYRVTEVRTRVEAADDALAAAQGHELLDAEPEALMLASTEAAEIAEVEQSVAAAEREVARFGADESERAAHRKQQLADLVQLYVIMGRFYVQRVGRVDFGLSCYSQALEVDPDNDAAFDALIEVYRSSQAWNELVAGLLARADRVKSPVRARDCRAQAAVIIAQKLNDEPKARTQLELVLAEDPAHELAHDTLAAMLTQHGDYAALGELLERRLSALLGEAKLDTRLKLAELYEDRLADPDRAEAHYVAVAEAAPRKLDAWKGLERVYARKENYEGLLSALRAQVDLAPTPRQRIALFERIGLLLEEEFVNYDEAAQAFERIITIDGTNEAGNLALARLYRHQSRFEDVVSTLLRLSNVAPDPKRKVELLLQVVRTFNVDIGSPDRAMEACERILEIDSEESEALSELVRLKSIAGDVASAVSAVERLAEQEYDLRKQAEHWIRAGKLLEEHGDRDGAIGRYKRALDSDSTALPAVDALRAIYARRGDAHGAIDMLNYAIRLSEGDRKRAQLYAELGGIQLERLEDEENAELAFNTALQLDPSCTSAQVGLGRIAFGREQFEQAATFLGTVLGRLDELPQNEASEVCRFAGDSFHAGGQMQKAIDAYKRARDFTPNDLVVNERHAALVRESGDAKAAERLYERIYSRFEDELDVPERLRVLRAWGETQLEADQAVQAIETFKEVLARKPDDLGALDGLTEAYKVTGAYQEMINLLQQRSRATHDNDLRFKLLVQTGDVFLEQIRDRDAAAQTYVMALDQQPNNRNLLTKLMAVYSDAQDWSRLIEVILRIAEMVDAPEQVAKYYNTAATIAHKELGRYDEAANYYEAALAQLPVDSGAAQLDALVECLIQNQDWERLERAYETRTERLRESGAAPVEIAALLDARGKALAEHLGRTSDALELFEQAQQLDPDNRDRREMLTAIYSKEPKRYFTRAVAAHRALLADDPYRVESLQALRRIYTSGKRPDESWCLCQALRCLQMADVDEEKFFKKYRLASLPRAKRLLDEELYRGYLWHPIQDASLTAIFATLAPAIVSTQSQPLTNFGIDPRNYADPTSDPTAMVRMLYHVGEMTAMHLPEVYHYPNDPGGLSFLFALPPAIGVGMGARAGGPQQALAFVAARHVSYYRPGHYIRQLVPTGTGLRTWLFAAIRMVVPKFPIPATMESAARECVEAIRTQLTGPQRDALRSLTQKLLDAAPELDMKSWMAGVDLSADRLGFVLSNDLKVANAVIEASPDDSSVVPKKDRARELLVYSVSEEYFELRKALGIALGG